MSRGSIQRTTFSVTTDAGGAATVYTTQPVDGEILALRVAIGTLAAGAVDLTFTDDDTGMTLLAITNLAATADFFPRAPATSPAGAAITNSFVPLFSTGRVKCVVAQGGAAASGTVTIWWR